MSSCSHSTKSKLKPQILIPNETDLASKFQPNELHRFSIISGQSGLFSTGPRPYWFVADRGAPTYLHHRVRFAAPGVSRPVTSFCADQNGNFITIHERLGKIGSQRLTIWNGLDDVFNRNGILPGGGYFATKINYGVTITDLEYVNDESIASGGHPILAMIVCHEIYQDQSELNDDGLTLEERQLIQEEKEAERTRRQVEADLGGFDVEDLEREDVFEINRNYGEAPKIQKERHEVWLVDCNGWNIVDKYELNDYEHALSIKVVSLTEVCAHV